MARKTTDSAKTPKAGTKGSASRRKATTPLGNTRALDDNSFVAPKKRNTKAEEQRVTLAEALAESGETIEELVEPALSERPTRPSGNSNLATTIRSHRKQYHVALAPNGKKTQNCGDSVAEALLNVGLAELAEFAGQLKPGANYGHLNPGHQRMCFGNIVRGAFRANDERALNWVAAKLPRAAEEE